MSPTLIIAAVAAFGALLGGAGSWRNRRDVRRLENKPPYRQLARALAERDEARRDNVRLRAECRKLMRECHQLRADLAAALRQLADREGPR